jgi:hypothetical protein
MAEDTAIVDPQNSAIAEVPAPDLSTSALAADPPAETPAPDAAAEDAPTPEPEPKPAPKQKNPLLDELTQQRARRREEAEGRIKAEERAARAEREAADAKAMVERLVKANGGDLPPPAPPAADRTPPAPPADLNAAVQMEVLKRDIASMRDKGFEAFGNAGFTETINKLVALGADSFDFVGSVLEAEPDAGHELLHELAQDEDKVLRLVKMSPTRRIAELTRMSVARQTAAKTADAKEPAAPAPKAPAAKVSQAPKPAPAISSSTATSLPRWSDKKSEKEIDADFDDWAKRRSARR